LGDNKILLLRSYKAVVKNCLQVYKLIPWYTGMANPEKTKITTIKIQSQTKERLDKLRVHKKDTYDEIVQRMLGILNVCRRDPDQAQETLEKLESLAKKNKLI